MLQAIIFDLDGTVVDNESEWEEAFLTVLANNKLVPRSLLRQPNGWIHEPGIGLGANWKRLVIDPKSQEKYEAETRKEYFDVSDGIRVRSGIVEVIDKATEAGMAIALATSSTWNTVEKELEELNMYLAFDVTTTGEEVLAHKPDPEIYTLTVQKLNFEPGECIVIEDSVAGIRAGMEAGCQTIGIVSDYAPAELLKAAGATYVVDSMEEILSLGVL